MKRLLLALALLFVPSLALAQAVPTGGATPFRYLSLASTNSVNVKSSMATLYNVTAIQTSATPYYIKFYDLAVAPTCGTSTPVLTYPIPGNSTSSGSGFTIPLGMAGARFINGLGFCITANAADSDNTNAATGITVSLTYF